MNDKLNILQAIKYYGKDGLPTDEGFVPEETFLERLPKIASLALGDACIASTPRKPSQEEMEELLKAIYYDIEVDF